jgi:hypothetical protein
MFTRRQLFKLAGAGAAALLVPDTVSYFLPPSCGWGAQKLKIRKTMQYLINRDADIWRYDATWDKPNGEPVQYYVDVGAEDDGVAIHCLLDRLQFDNGIPNSDQFKLALPRGIDGSYIYVPTDRYISAL